MFSGPDRKQIEPPISSLFEWLLIGVKMMFKRSKEQEKKGSEKREDLLVSF